MNAANFTHPASNKPIKVAHRALRAARNDYDKALGEVVAGKREYDATAMQQKRTQIALLGAAFNAACIGVVTWKRPS